MFSFLAIEAKASTLRGLFRIGLSMNSAKRVSVLMVDCSPTSSASTCSNAPCLEAAEYRAEAYLPSKLNTWIGG